MLGNEEDARFIRDWHFGGRRDDWGNPVGELPEGWGRLGSGSYRIAYLSPDGVVYKVQQRYALPGEYEGQSNKSEAENLRRFWLIKMPPGCRLPRFQFFELDGKGVMAMERLGRTLSQYSQWDEKGSNYWALRNKLYRTLTGVCDLHGGNLAVDEERDLLVPIDLGG